MGFNSGFKGLSYCVFRTTPDKVSGVIYLQGKCCIELSISAPPPSKSFPVIFTEPAIKYYVHNPNV
jgi:hypothetical protein